MASLTDALDIARHLFMFHVITELLILLIVAALLDLWSRRRARPITVAAPSREVLSEAPSTVSLSRPGHVEV